MRQYELVLVFDGKATSAKKKSSLEKTNTLITTLGGKVLETLDWGVKELSYPIKKLTSGAYFILDIEIAPKSAGQINEKLRLEEDVLRYLLMTKEPKLIRIKNRQKQSVPTEPKEAK